MTEKRRRGGRILRPASVRGRVLGAGLHLPADRERLALASLTCSHAALLPRDDYARSPSTVLFRVTGLDEAILAVMKEQERTVQIR